MKKVFLLMLSFFASVTLVSAAVGDVIHQLNATQLPVPGFPNHCSVGLAFDGTHLYYDICSDSKIYKIDPITGALNATIETNFTGFIQGPNAMAFDVTRNGIWFGRQTCLNINGTNNMPIYFLNLSDNSITLMFAVPATLLNPATNQSFLGFCFLDGLAFNANEPGEADDELWFSDDINPNLGIFRTDGTFVQGFDATTTNASLATLSGLAIGGSNLYMANNGGGKVFRANKTSLAFVDQFTSQEERLEDMECDPVTFSGMGKEVMWVRHTPQSVEADDLIDALETEPVPCG